MIFWPRLFFPIRPWPDKPDVVVVIKSFQFSFFRENVVVIAILELRPGSNERYENSTFYGLFRFLIFILISNK